MACHLVKRYAIMNFLEVLLFKCRIHLLCTAVSGRPLNTVFTKQKTYRSSSVCLCHLHL